MSHVNTTPHYGLPIYGENDIINPLTDFNDANSAIDTALYDIADAQGSEAGAISDINTFLGDKGLETVAQNVTDAVNEVNTAVGNADTAIGNVAGDVVTLQGAVGDANTGLIHDVSALQTTVGSQGNSITALQGTVGDANSGLVKSVSDLQNEVNNLGADDISYTPVAGRLSSTNVQDAIDEVYNVVKGGDILASVTADGVKTYATLLGELWTAVQSNISKVWINSKIIIGGDIFSVTEVSAGVIIGTYSYIQGSTYKLAVQDVRISSTPQWLTGYMSDAATGTWHGEDSSSVVPANGTVISIIA